MRVQGKILSLTFIILFLVLFTGCGKTEDKTPWDVQEIWNAISAAEDFPEMISVPENRLGYMFGIEQKDYTQAMIAVSADSLRADEIWLIEAVDEAAARRMEEFAKIRLAQKEEETRSYAPEQYRIVQEAKLELNGLRLIMIVSPSSEEILEKLSG